MEGTPIPPPLPSSDPALARSKVQTPALLLIIFGALGLLFSLGGLLGLSGQLMAALANSPDLPQEARDALLQSTGRTWAALPGLVLSGLMLFGGLKMKSLQAYPMALTAAVVALIPCVGINGCCCIAIPVGVWALVVLLRPEVKGAFRP